MFNVTYETIDKLLPIEGADKILQVVLKDLDYTLVAGKDNNYTEGDKVIYFPVDSLLPEDILQKTGFVGMLSGPLKNRVKTKKLRGVYSQGILCKPSVLGLNGSEENLTDLLGVKKYEVPEKFANGGKLCNRPEHVYCYDIEGAQNVPRFMDSIKKKNVIVTEKLEGMHTSVTIDKNDYLHVCSRNYRVESVDGERNIWLDIVKKLDIENKMRTWLKKFNNLAGKTITLRRELIGPQCQENYYGLKENDIQWFEFEIDGKPVDAIDFFGDKDFLGVGLTHVPILAYDWPSEDVFPEGVKAYADGMSCINPQKLREGVVVKLSREEPEQLDRKLKRNFVKFRSLKYLDKSDN